MSIKPPLPPFSRESAIEKVRLAEDAWNSRDPLRVAQVYSPDTHWRNRAEYVDGRDAVVAFLQRKWAKELDYRLTEYVDGRDAVVAFLQRKWAKELDYRLIKELWAFDGARIAVRFAYEWHDDSGNWYRSYGNENWQFNDQGLMVQRHACINDCPIKDAERHFHWPLGRRPDNVPALSDFGF
ncbi:DUF1348 family protein [Serratia odorifera]|uniref:SnoaL-like domain-containing protein n=1 Tax=Serratia odorifera DSM 4582 TaxID=667129 RepID=D4E3U0_SEROD|nr:nuclear transport factor 2 family protein [Serratia odorifera]EFE95638.1 hypothetical protein HMPREF0758_2840 [Serratia odorifera DSM 4582]PNK90210.1 DUF1348 domain-containing protein [Serratia odorifera]RII71349.1 nuclear transport factor 2 family protein [Serratia odorifera]